MAKILAIGNSFSQNANHYFYDIAHADGVSQKNVNLFIGGCPLSRHFRNIMADAEAYDFQFDGRSTGLQVSIDKVLLSDNWDYITLQQASHESFRWECYEPYLETVAEHVRALCPGAKLGIHETWAYSSIERMNRFGLENAEEMFGKLKECYEKAAKVIDADFFIPSGEVMIEGVRHGLDVHAADGFHAGMLGEYMLGLAWNSVINGKNAEGNTFRIEGDPIDEDIVLLAQEIVDEVIAR
ncbi:MAG: DUF4886 domain-containing protein [Clostridia bacterium]|nr:DUF4886 domain-containing protein [Clostridia bacterium]